MLIANYMYTSDEDLASLGFFGDGFNSLAGDFLLEDFYAT